MNALTEKKIYQMLKFFDLTPKEMRKLYEIINNDEFDDSDIVIYLKKICLIRESKSGIAVERYCPHCGMRLSVEDDLDILYPYVCHNCDENFYEFETLTIGDFYRENIK